MVAESADDSPALDDADASWAHGKLSEPWPEGRSISKALASDELQQPQANGGEASRAPSLVDEPQPSPDELIERQLNGADSPRGSCTEATLAAACAGDAYSQTSAKTTESSRTYSEASSSLSSASLQRVTSPPALGWMSLWRSPMRSEALALQIVESDAEWE